MDSRRTSRGPVVEKHWFSQHGYLFNVELLLDLLCCVLIFHVSWDEVLDMLILGTADVRGIPGHAICSDSS
jgi:hypothetical protein